MRVCIGVVGPHDLVASAAGEVREAGGLQAVELGYDHEDEAVGLVRDHADDVDAWLFTGVVPHDLALASGVLTHPAEHVSYSGLTLLAALFRLHREGADVERMSIDTLPVAEVAETMAAAGLDPARVKVHSARPPVRSERVVTFHRNAARRGASVAVTCLRSAYETLAQEIPTVRLVPSPRDTREAIASLELRIRERQHSDAQLVLGLVQLDHDDELVESYAAPLGGTVTKVGTGHYLLVTTRGLLERATDDLTRAPMLDRLQRDHKRAHLGFGVGRSPAEAAALAARAMSRAKATGAVGAAVSERDDVDLVLPSGVPGPRRPEDLSRLASRVGLSRATLQAIRTLTEETDGPLTATDVARAFDIQERSARRLLKRLERATVAIPVGTVLDGRSGRPPVLYRIEL